MSDVPTVHQRMAAVVAALSYIPKERSKGVSYEFRGIDAVMGALHGPLADNGLYLAPRVLDDWQVNAIPGKDNRTQHQALFRVCVDVYAEDGSMTTLGPGLAQSHDYGDKAVYQAQQNAIKYLLLEAFCIPTSEQDMDAREADPSPSEPDPEPDLSAVDAAIVDALSAGLEVDADTVRAHASKGPDWAEQAVRALRKRIDEADDDAPVDICDVCGEPEDGHTHEPPKDVPSEQEEGDATEPGKPAERSESGEGGHEPSSPDTPNPCKTCGPEPRTQPCPDCPADDREELPWERADRLEISATDQMVKLKELSAELKATIPARRQYIGTGKCHPGLSEAFVAWLDEIEEGLSQPVGANNG